MLTTATVACALGCVRFAGHVTGETEVASFTLSVAMAAGICCVVSLLTTVPSLYATLRMRRLVLGLGIAFALGLLVVTALVVIASIPNGPPPLEMIRSFGGLAITFATAISVPLLVARRLGYRLQTRWSVDGVLPSSI